MEASGRSSTVARAGMALMVVGALVLIVSAITRWAGDASSNVATTAESAPADTTSGSMSTDSVVATEATDVPVGVQPDGFTTIEARITDANGEVCEVCLWLADDSAERAQGLMGVTELGDADGMVFRFDEARVGSFFMFQTPTPLSIAWFGPDGFVVGTADMEPCLDTSAGACPLYSPDRAYDLAVEVFQGDLGELGIGPGSRIELVAGTEAATCR